MGAITLNSISVMALGPNLIFGRPPVILPVTWRHGFWVWIMMRDSAGRASTPIAADVMAL